MIASRVRLAVLAFSFGALVDSCIICTASEDASNPTDKAIGDAKSDLEDSSIKRLFLDAASLMELSFKGALEGATNLWSGTGNVRPVIGGSLKLFHPEEPQEGCRVGILAGSDLPISELHLGLNAAQRLVTAKFHKEVVQERHDDKRGVSRSETSFETESSLLLPAHCISKGAVLLAHLGGCLFDNEPKSAAGTTRGLVVLPSAKLLKKYVEQGLLPENIVDAVSEGQMEVLNTLTSEQHCLAAGFTVEECQKLGGRKPSIVGLSPSEDSDAISVPVYDVSLAALD